MWSHSNNYCREILCIIFIKKIKAEEQKLHWCNKYVNLLDKYNAVWKLGLIGKNLGKGMKS